MSFTDKTMVLYRGSLKSCNYHCSYCPFSKHKGSRQEYEKDRQQWQRFVDRLLERTDLKIAALMIVPYGEALIHPWYWKGMGQLASSPYIDAVGAQTNLSFPVETSLKIYREAGGITGKLHLWATFHPQMTDAETFAKTCRRLSEEGISLCAGVVGVPEQIETIRHLRSLLPEDIYLWVNKMDGLRRRYTDEEQSAFTDIDPFFPRELLPIKADPLKCHNRLFIEADGTLKSCNISSPWPGNWYDCQEHLPGDPSICKRKQCSCYLAYGGRSDPMNRILFGDYPLFRIPRRSKAAFLDIEGTLLHGGQIPEQTKLDLKLLKDQSTKLFFATTLPYEEAAIRCKAIWHLFEGGVFSCGAHILWKEERKNSALKEKVYPIEEEQYLSLEKLGKKWNSRILVYKRAGIICKITFLRPRNHPWKQEETEQIIRQCETLYKKELRMIIEGHCLEIIASNATKAEGVKLLCQWLGISPTDTTAAGDSQEDEEMMKLCQRNDT